MSGLCSLLTREWEPLGAWISVVIHEQRGSIGMSSYYLGRPGLDTDIKDVVAECGVRVSCSGKRSPT